VLWSGRLAIDRFFVDGQCRNGRFLALPRGLNGRGRRQRGLNILLHYRGAGVVCLKRVSSRAGVLRIARFDIAGLARRKSDISRWAMLDIRTVLFHKGIRWLIHNSESRVLA